MRVDTCIFICGLEGRLKVDWIYLSTYVLLLIRQRSRITRTGGPHKRSTTDFFKLASLEQAQKVDVDLSVASLRHTDWLKLEINHSHILGQARSRCVLL